MSNTQTLYDHIAANNRKTWFLILLFPFSLFVLIALACIASVYALGDNGFMYDGLRYLFSVFPQVQNSLTEGNMKILSGIGHALYILLPIFIVSCLWMSISYLFGDAMILRFARATPLQKEDNAKVFTMVENVALAAGLPMPRVYIIEDKGLNAFATGKNPNSATIVLTRGIIDALEPLELEGVIAHEMAHIGNRDIRLNMLVITGLSVFGFAADILRSYLSHIEPGNKKQMQFFFFVLLIMIALLVFNFVVAPLIRFVISRRREYAADATGALITRNPLALAHALEKIANHSHVESLEKQPRLGAMCIANPKLALKEEKESLYSTHPPLQNRIRRLKRSAGIF